MKRYFILITVILLIVDYNVGFGQSDLKNGEHSAIVEADGYVYLAEDKTIKELREEAKTAAKREALEKGQTYIKSLTKVENFQLTYDIIWGVSEGYVKILESKDYGITPDNRYHYWIKAEIKYSIKSPDKKVPLDIFSNEKAPLTVRLWTEKNEYIAEGEIKIFIKGNKDFYANIVYEDAAGNLLQLLPNQYRKDNLFKANNVYIIPDVDDNFILKVQSPFGTEKIFLYASSAVLGEAEVKPYGESFYSINDNINEYSDKTRGVKKLNYEQEDQGAEFFETNCLIVTQNK